MADKLDLGLSEDLKSLTQDDTCDLTFKVAVGSGEEYKNIKLHKSIARAVSKLFARELHGGENEANEIEICGSEGDTFDTVSTIVTLFYTGDKKLLQSNAARMLPIAVKYKMTAVYEACTKIMIDDLNPGNCLKFVRLFEQSGHKEAYLQTRHWIDRNFYVIHKMSDFETLKTSIDSIMSQFRFRLIGTEDLKTIKKMMIYKKSAGKWKKMVTQALAYKMLPIRQKIKCRPAEQGAIRSEAQPVVFHTMDPDYSYYIPTVWPWCTSDIRSAPTMKYFAPSVLVINNFMIVRAKGPTNLAWFAFDPRENKWDTFTEKDLKPPRRDFPMVYHKEHIYALGGNLGKMNGKEKLSAKVEKYDFQHDEWQHFGEMPFAAKLHAACLLDDVIYVSGGMRTPADKGKKDQGVCSANMDCLDINTGVWESKAAMLKPMADHKMHTIHIDSVKETAGKSSTIVAFSKTLDVEMYKPETDQWTVITVETLPRVKFPNKCKAMILMAEGANIYFLNYGKPKEKFTLDEDFLSADMTDSYENRERRFELRRKRNRVTCPMISKPPKRSWEERDTSELYGSKNPPLIIKLKLSDEDVVETVLPNYPYAKEIQRHGYIPTEGETMHGLPYGCVLSTTCSMRTVPEDDEEEYDQGMFYKFGNVGEDVPKLTPNWLDYDLF